MSILISAVDKFTAPVKKIVGMSDKMTSAMLKGQRSINALAHQQRTIARISRAQPRERIETISDGTTACCIPSISRAQPRERIETGSTTAHRYQ